MVYALGWREVGNATVGTEVIDGGRDSVRIVEFENPDEVDRVSKLDTRNKLTQGYRVKAKTAPKKVLWKSKNRVIPDVTSCYNTLIVSDRFRKIVEDFEPDVHQFLPVDIYRPKCGEPEARHYWLVICQRIDSVDREHTTMTLEGRFGSGVWQTVSGGSNRLTFNLNAVGDAHLWNDPRLTGGREVSTDLGNALKAAELTGLSMKYYEDI